jgi:hypothetical protein
MTLNKRMKDNQMLVPPTPSTFVRPIWLNLVFQQGVKQVTTLLMLKLSVDAKA